MVWATHYEGDCKTCSLGLKIKKGRMPPKRGSLGRKKTSESVRTVSDDLTTNKGFLSQALIEHIHVQELSTRPSVNHTENFGDNFEFVEEVKEDFNCAICREILGSPIKTKCKHYFCAGCLRQAVNLAITTLVCPVYKEEILPVDLKQPSRMILRLKRCKNKCHYEDSERHICPNPTTENAAKGMQVPVPQVPKPAPVPTLPLIPPEGRIKQAMMELKEGMISTQVEKLATLYVKSKLKESKDGNAMLKTGGKVSQHKLAYNFGKKKSFTYVGIGYSMPLQNSVSMSAPSTVRQAQKLSNMISDRHVRTRTRDLQRSGSSVSGDQMNIHVVKHLSSIRKAEREKMLRNALGKELVLELPEGEALAMKADLGLSRFRLNKLRRLVI